MLTVLLRPVSFPACSLPSFTRDILLHKPKRDELKLGHDRNRLQRPLKKASSANEPSHLLLLFRFFLFLSQTTNLTWSPTAVLPFSFFERKKLGARSTVAQDTGAAKRAMKEAATLRANRGFLTKIIAVVFWRRRTAKQRQRTKQVIGMKAKERPVERRDVLILPQQQPA